MRAQLFTRTEPILLPFFPRQFYLALRSQGFADEQIFQGTELSAQKLHDESFRLTIEQHEQFILRMLDLTDDPHFALKLMKMQDPSMASLPMLAAVNSGHINKALQAITRYNKLITRVFTMNMRDGVESAVIDIDVHVEHDRVSYFAVTSIALFLSHFFRDALEGANLVRRLDLSVSEPEGFAAVCGQFPFQVRFAQANCCIELEEALLDRPLRQADPQTVRLLTDMAEAQLREADAETSLAGAVKLLLLEHISSPPSLDEAALHLGLSPRSLRRKLAESGTSFQGVLDAVRLSVARRLIRETNVPMASIGYELGFNHPSDFGRAFKRWSGQSPMAYRAQAQ